MTNYLFLISPNYRFRVWDYPVKELYTNMFKVIKENIPVSSAKEGFMRVQEAVKGDFAFVHDAATVRYEVRQNCDLKVRTPRFLYDTIENAKTA